RLKPLLRARQRVVHADGLRHHHCLHRSFANSGATPGRRSPCRRCRGRRRARLLLPRVPRRERRFDNAAGHSRYETFFFGARPLSLAQLPDPGRPAPSGATAPEPAAPRCPAPPRPVASEPDGLPRPALPLWQMLAQRAPAPAPAATGEATPAPPAAAPRAPRIITVKVPVDKVG